MAPSANHLRSQSGYGGQGVACQTICAPTDKSPNPTGGNPVVGVASAIDYPWCVAVADGDSARNIAERITGDRSRYVEIIASNPQIPTAMVDGAIDFAPGSLCVGGRLRMPPSFGPWIDQYGNPRGQRVAFAPYDTKPADWRPVFLLDGALAA